MLLAPAHFSVAFNGSFAHYETPYSCFILLCAACQESSLLWACRVRKRDQFQQMADRVAELEQQNVNLNLEMVSIILGIVASVLCC